MMNVSKKLFLAFLAVVFVGMSAFAAPDTVPAVPGEPGIENRGKNAAPSKAEEGKTDIPSTPSPQVGTNKEPVFLNPQETNAGGGNQGSDITSSAESSGDVCTVILITLAAIGVIAAGAAVCFLLLIKRQTDCIQNGLPTIWDQVNHIIELGIDKKLDGIGTKLQSFSPDEQLRADLTKAEEARARFEGELASAREDLEVKGKALAKAETELEKANGGLKDLGEALTKAKTELQTANEKLETAEKDLAARKTELAEALKAAGEKNEALTAAKAELETARQNLETARKELTGKGDELTQVKNALSAKVNALTQFEESAKTQSETLKKQYDEAIAARDDFYGQDCEELRRNLLEAQKVSRESGLALVAAWLSLATTRQMLPDRLRSAIEVFDGTVWGIFGKDDLDRLHAVRRYLLPRVQKLLEGTDFSFTWPEPGTELKNLDDKEYRIESGFRAVRYATCGCIRRKGDVVTSSRVVCEDE